MEARAHVEDDAHFAMPVSAHTGGDHHTRAMPGGCAGVAAIGRRASGAGGAQEAGLGAPPGLVRFNRFRQGALKPTSVGAFKLSQELIS